MRILIFYQKWKAPGQVRNHQGEFYRDIAKKYRDINLVVNFLRVALSSSNN